MNHSRTLCTALAISLILACYLRPAYATSNSQMQMLPPTIAGGSGVCPGGNALLFFGGSQGNDAGGNPISAINCLPSSTPTTLDPTTGDLWLGATNATGDTWTHGTGEIGPRLHLSGNTGLNSDDIYFQRHNMSPNTSVLNLVIGDDVGAPYGGSSGGSGDAFIIGATHPGSSAVVPLFTFASDGTLSVNGTVNATSFRANQDVPTNGDASTNGFAFGADGDTGMFSPLRTDGGTNHLYDNGELGFFVNNFEAMHIKYTGNVGINTASPQTTLDVNGGIRPGSSGVTTGASCSPEGTFAYDLGAHAPVYCNSGGVWTRMGGGGTLVATESISSGNNGSTSSVTSSNAHTLCMVGYAGIWDGGHLYSFDIEISRNGNGTWTATDHSSRNTNINITCYDFQ